MAGHSHWAGIKHKKEITDKKKGATFSKLLAAVTAAAKRDPNPDFNPRLRTMVEKARAQNVPASNIERAIQRASEAGGAIEELLFEAYGPGGVALLIEATTDSKNRTVAEVKKLLTDFEGKWAEPGSVRWAFEEMPGGGWTSKFPLAIDTEVAAKLHSLVEALEEHADVQAIYTNTSQF
ncbi:MAG: YebC/PmpR family DNA-binding transcriptional regulator [Candidatus Liptonbacteria bacterium]|nr:YebC/PmpR family DNA-binding transcriptional regulator [Candidatus Liptonbacteria bacterium]